MWQRHSPGSGAVMWDIVRLPKRIPTERASKMRAPSVDKKPDPPGMESAASANSALTGSGDSGYIIR